jgi:hypothetical protein
MNLLLRTFNDSINSKTGSPIPSGMPKRGTPEWLEFEELLIHALKKEGVDVTVQLENPLVPNLDATFDRFGYVHKTKRDCPNGSLFWMQMHLRNIFTLDHNGWGADHSDNNPGMFYDLGDEHANWVSDLSDDLWKNNCSKIDQSLQVDCNINVPFILVPLQIPRDYTILWHSPITVKYFLDSIQAWAHSSQNHVAFKLHPMSARDFDLIIAVDEAVSNSKYCHKVGGNIHELIKRSAGLFVINSGVGFESIIHGKPVCTFGDCDYNRVTFNADIRRLDEARNFIYDFDENKQKIARKFIYWYVHEHAFYLKSKSIEQKLEEYIKSWIKS